MKNEYNHYFAVICFTGAMMALGVFLFFRWTMSIIATFFCLQMAQIYRREYQFNRIKEMIK